MIITWCFVAFGKSNKPTLGYKFLEYEVGPEGQGDTQTATDG